MDQTTDADRLIQVSGIGGRLAGYAESSADRMNSGANMVPSSGSLTIFAVLEREWFTNSGGLVNMGTGGTTTGMSTFVSSPSIANDWTEYSLYASGNGSGAGRAPHVNVPAPFVVSSASAAARHAGVVMFRLGASNSEARWNDAPGISTVETGGPLVLGADAKALAFAHAGIHYRMHIFDADLSRADQLLVHDALTQAYPFAGR
jgi:hypothetical protein